MTIKKLESASKILAQITDLDREIIAIDKMALSIANEDTEVNFQMSVKTVKEEGAKVSFGSKKEEDKDTDTLKNLIPANVALQFLGVWLGYKQQQRMNLINSIKKMGFQL